MLHLWSLNFSFNRWYVVCVIGRLFLHRNKFQIKADTMSAQPPNHPSAWSLFAGWVKEWMSEWLHPKCQPLRHFSQSCITLPLSTAMPASVWPMMFPEKLVVSSGTEWRERPVLGKATWTLTVLWKASLNLSVADRAEKRTHYRPSVTCARHKGAQGLLSLLPKGNSSFVTTHGPQGHSLMMAWPIPAH